MTDAATIKKWAILDSGAMSYFLTTNAPATNIIPATVPLIPCLPNGNKVQSTHTCTLDLPALPVGARAAHIIPSLASHSLLSVVIMCNVRCTVTFTKINCTIAYRGRTIICGHKCTRTGLWMVPLNETDTQAANPPISSAPTTPTATPTFVISANVDATLSAAKYACYIHQCMCSPLSATLLGALDRSEELATIPGLTPASIKNHLPCYTATNKRHMCRHRSNTASTQICRTTLSLREPRSTTCSPDTNYVPCRMYFVLPHLPMPSRAQCTQTSLVPSRFDCSKVCNTSLLHMSMISMPSLFVPCPIAQMHPW